MFEQKFDFYSPLNLKAYNLDQIMRYQLDVLGKLDPFTRKHSENVANLCCRICEYLRCKSSFTVHCTIGGYLHDIGKLFIPPEILNKPDKLTPEEYEVIKTHTTLGYDMCMKDPHLRPYALFALDHHEALNGSGYPNGITKKDIPYGAQIVRVADEYDALVTKRQYTTHINISETLKDLIKDAQPDPRFIALDQLNTHEKEGKMTFYGTMILEGLIAMIWAAAAMGLYNSGSTAGATAAGGEVAKGLLGPVGGIIAILGVIVLPITSGDTALRSCRLMIADYIHYDQRKKKNRVILTICMFVPVIAILVFAKLNAEGFNILWRYFAWSNQTIAVFAFAAITVYLMAKKGSAKWVFLVPLVPGSFYMFVISSFILSAKIGFGLSMNVAYIIAAILTAVYAVGVYMLGRKYAAKHTEE